MESREQENLYRLASFADSLLLPAAAFDAVTSLTSWQVGSAIEAFLWLDVGVKVGAFPEEPAVALAEQLAPNVTDALTEFESRALGSLIPPHMTDMLARSLRENTFFRRENMGYHAAPHFAGLFDTAVMNAVMGLRDSRQAQLFEYLHGDSSHPSMTAEPAPISLAMIQALESTGTTADTSGDAQLVWLFTGCVGRWMDMDRFLTEAAGAEEDKDARLGLAGDLASIQSWRFCPTDNVRQQLMSAAAGAVQLMRDHRPAPTRGSVPWEVVEADAVNQLSSLIARWQKLVDLQYASDFASA